MPRTSLHASNPIYPGYPGYGYPIYGWGYPCCGYPVYGWGYPYYGWGYPYYGYGFGVGFSFGGGGYWGPGATYIEAGEGGGGGGGEGYERTGSIRLKVSPSTAQVYIDGALAGTAAEFGGLSGHLTIGAGDHQLELRSAGYETYRGSLTVVADKTMTTRVTLKKQ